MQELRRFRGTPVLVDAQQRGVERVARIHEVVGVAAEEGDVVLRLEYEPHVGPDLVTVDPVLGAAVERHHFAAQLRLLAAGLFDRGNAAVALGGLRRIHFGGHVRVRDELARFDAGARALLRALAREEAAADQVLARRRQVLRAVERDVGVGEVEAVGRDERGRCAGRDRRKAQLVEPFARRVELVLRLQERHGRLVVGPHPVIGRRAK